MTTALANRESAARELARQLDFLRGLRPLVLGVPRGGVPMGRILADELEGDLDVILVHKIAAPGDPEFAIGAVDEAGRVILHESAQGVSERDLDESIRNGREILRRRRALYTPGRGALAIRGRTVVIVDDGVATGATLEAAIRSVRQEGPASVIIAAGVISRAALRYVKWLADRVVYVRAPEHFFSVGECYLEFRAVNDEKVVAALRSGREPEPALAKAAET